MVLTGIADEGGKDIETQVKAHKALGWDHIELRLVDGKNVAGELDDAGFDDVCRVLDRENMRVAGFASAIGNWSRHINDDFAIDMSDLNVSCRRMQSMGTKTIRIMSWVGDGVEESRWRAEAIRRCKELTKVAADNDIYISHENCTGWGGLSVQSMLEMQGEIDDPHFVLLYDIGNVLSHHAGDPLEYFEVIRGKFAYVHVKDGKRQPGDIQYTYCGEGDAKVAEILAKIIGEDGYDGVISIEPHVASVVHLDKGGGSPEAMFKSYGKYGQMLKDIVAKIRTPA